MNSSKPCVVLFTVVSIFVTMSSHAQLQGRLPASPGGTDYQAAYDTDLDITWLTNAGFSGLNSWDGLLAWVDGLNNANHLGFNDWRLASMSVAAGLPVGLTESDGETYADNDSIADCSVIWQPLCADNELGYMYFHNLGGSVSSDLTGDQTVGDVTLTNIQPIYWSSTASGITNAWMFHFNSSAYSWWPKNALRHGWVVRAGDVIADADGDGVDDATDNCTFVLNPLQIDADGDGCGNICDADLDNNGLVGFADLALFAAAFFSTDPVADFNASGTVDYVDLSHFGELFFQPSGPGAFCNQ